MAKNPASSAATPVSAVPPASAAPPANVATPVNEAQPANAEIIVAATPEDVSNAIKSAGCAVFRVEHEGVVYLHSASQGIGFQVQWGNKIADGKYADFTLSCPLRVQGGKLSDAVCSDWYRTKRFARVLQHSEFVALEMDVLVAGGVTHSHLTVALQLWNQMMGEFFSHLRNFKPVPAPDAAAAAAAFPAQSEAGGTAAAT